MSSALAAEGVEDDDDDVAAPSEGPCARENARSMRMPLFTSLADALDIVGDKRNNRERGGKGERKGKEGKTSVNKGQQDNETAKRSKNRFRNHINAFFALQKKSDLYAKLHLYCVG